MSLPALPDIFGNYVLGDFNEVVSPPAIDWLPQTPGWYVVGAALLALILRSAWRHLRHWYRNRYRREARHRLQALENANDPLAEINAVLKLSAMAAFSREQVAHLSGEEWTHFLNSCCTAPAFDESVCQLLSDGVYRGQGVDANARTQLLSASLTWVANHKNRFDD